MKALSTFRLWVAAALLAAAPLLFAQSASAHSGHQHHGAEISFSADDFAALASMAEQAEAATTGRDGARQAEQRLEPTASGDPTAACHHSCCSAAAGCCAASCLAVEAVHAGFFGNSCCVPVGAILPTDGVEPSGLSEPPNGSA